MVGFVFLVPEAVAAPIVVSTSYKDTVLEAPPGLKIDSYKEPVFKGDYRALAYELAIAKGIDGDTIVAVIDCESSFNPNAIGDNGTSFGLSQIHLPAHPHIKKSQALDPEFAITFMVSEFEKGNAWKWTCWKKLYR